MPEYGRSDYWDERYSNDAEPFDWYQRWAGLKTVIGEYIDSRHRVLNVGAGTSRLSEDLYEEGIKNIVNIDISPVATKIMTERCAKEGKTELKYMTMDVCDMSEFEANSFDTIIDKGTLDSIICGEKSAETVPQALDEIYRILRRGGRYIVISYGEPQFRLNHLENDEKWTVLVKNTPKPSIPLISPSMPEKAGVHYIYICTKEAAATAGQADTTAALEE